MKVRSIVIISAYLCNVDVKFNLELLSLEKQQHEKLLYEKKANLRAQTE